MTINIFIHTNNKASEVTKIIVETSSAVTLAVIKNNAGLFTNKKVGIIISGGIADLNQLPW